LEKPLKNSRLSDQTIESLTKTIEVLMDKIESSQDSQDSAFAIFERNIFLRKKVEERTSELEALSQNIFLEKSKLINILKSLPGAILLIDKDCNVLELHKGVNCPDLCFCEKENLAEIFGAEIDNRLDSFFKTRHTPHAEEVFTFNHEITYQSEPLILQFIISTLSDEIFILSMRDVTQALNNEKKIKEQEEKIMQSSHLAALGEMAGGIAHEINNPLTVITSSAKLILKNLYKEDELNKPVLIEKVDAIYKMAMRISEITFSMKNLSRDTGKDHFQPTLIQDIVSDVSSLFFERLNGQSIAFKINLSLPSKSVYCSRVQVCQVLINLLNNAYDAVENCENSWIELTVSENHHATQFKVMDSGPGVISEIRDKIFDPFFTTKDIGKGSGLGLGLSKSIAEKHMGRFYLDQTSPHTSFILEIPKSLEGYMAS
jgi:C4-dicarboxylate-specific signal transduction histidine kinase